MLCWRLIRKSLESDASGRVGRLSTERLPSFLGDVFFLRFILFLIMCGFVHIGAVPKEARRGHYISETGVAVGCELPCGHWEPNPGPSEEQSVL